MTKIDKSPWKNAAYAIVSMIAVAIGLSIKYDFYYDLNDDTVIRDIISGIYTGTATGYNIQMLYPFSALIALFYKAIPTVAWYGLFLCGLQFVAIGIILCRVLELLDFTKKWQKIVLGLISLLVIVTVVFRWLVIIQYTVTSGLLMIAAIFVFITEKSEKKLDLLPITLVILSYLIRTEMCLMLFPLLAVAGIVRWLEEKEPFNKQNLKRYLGTIGLALGLMLLFIGIDKLAYKVSPDAKQWDEYREFFDARTQLYDFYGVPEYEKSLEVYEECGISYEQYMLLKNYNFALDTSIDASCLKKLANVQKQRLHHIIGPLYTKNSLKEGIWLYKEQILKLKNGILSEIVLIGYLILLFICFRLSRVKSLIKIVLLAFVRSGLWLYLLLVDRTLDRVTVPLLVAEFTILAAWIIKELSSLDNTRKETKFFANGLLLVLCLISASLAIENISATSAEYNKRQQIQPIYDSLLDYTKEAEDFLVVDVYSSTSYEGTPFSEKIFVNVDNSFRSLDICGGWLVKSPLTDKKLEKAQITDVQSGLLSQKAKFVAFADKDMLWLTQVYAAKGKSININPVDSIKYKDKAIFEVYEIEEIKD